MTRYEKMIKRMDEAMKKHPRSYVVLDSVTFEIIATGRDMEKLTPKIRACQEAGRIPVIGRKPKDNVVLVF